MCLSVPPPAREPAGAFKQNKSFSTKHQERINERTINISFIARNLPANNVEGNLRNNIGVPSAQSRGKGERSIMICIVAT